MGSRIARRLAEYGCDVLLLEKRQRLGGRVCCAGIIGLECLDAFDIDSNLVLRKLNSARLYSPAGKLIRLQRRQDQAVVMDRAAFDLFMAEQAKTAGAEYILNISVRNIKIGDDGVVVEAESGSKRLQYEARAAVIATGFGSKLTERVGLGKATDYVFGAQAEVTAPGIEEVEIYTGGKVAPGFFGWLVPTSQPKALVGLMAHKSPQRYLENFIERLRSEGKISGDFGAICCRGITLKPPPKTYGRRLIIAGDAAGQVKPITGGGIYFGLLSADIAADSLKKALEKDDLSARSLAGYQRGWQDRLGREIRTGCRARRIYEKLNDGQIDSLLDIAVNGGIIDALVKADDLSFDWHGKAVARILRRKALSSALAVMKIPFRIGTG